MIPTFEREDTIGNAISSALNQEHQPFEVIVVDDGSTDGTEQVVRTFGAPVRYVRQDNQGVSAARNVGVKLAVGEWIAFLDSDDVWRPKHLRNVAEAIIATEGTAGFYFADAWIVSREFTGSWYATCGFDPRSPFEVTEPGFNLAMLPRQPMVTSSTVVRRSTWESIGGFREDLPTREDTHLYFMLGLVAAGCAIRSIGSDKMSNEADDMSLMQLYDTTSRTYGQATVTLYSDVLRRPEVPARHRTELRGRLSDGYWKLAKADAREGAWVRSLDMVVRSVASHPASIGPRFVGAAHRLGRSFKLSV